MRKLGGRHHENEKNAESGTQNGKMRRLPNRSAGDAWELAEPEAGLHGTVGGGRLRKGKIHCRDRLRPTPTCCSSPWSAAGGHGGGHGEGQRYGAEECILHRYGRGQNGGNFCPGGRSTGCSSTSRPMAEEKERQAPSDPPDISGQILPHRPGRAGKSTSKPITPPCLPTVWKNLPPAVWK